MLLEESKRYRPSMNRNYAINLIEEEIEKRKQVAEQMKRLNER